MALYALEESDLMPVLPTSVQLPTSIVDDRANPIADVCEPNVETE